MMVGQISPNASLFKDNQGRTIQSTVPLKTKNYSDGTYSYVCQAAANAALTDSSWFVTRITTATGDTTFSVNSDGVPGFHSVATNLAAVAALTYAAI